MKLRMMKEVHHEDYNHSWVHDWILKKKKEKILTFFFFFFFFFFAVSESLRRAKTINLSLHKNVSNQSMTRPSPVFAGFDLSKNDPSARPDDDLEEPQVDDMVGGFLSFSFLLSFFFLSFFLLSSLSFLQKITIFLFCSVLFFSFLFSFFFS